MIDVNLIGLMTALVDLVITNLTVITNMDNSITLIHSSSN